MATDIPTKEPISIRAGDTIQWTREDLTADYPASSWTLTYTIINSAAKYTVTATADSEYFDVTIAKATSALYTPGIYTLTGRVSDATYAYTVYTGTLEILPDLTASTTYDTRSHARIMLDYIESTLEGKADDATLDILSKTFGDKNIARNPELLMRWKTYYESIYSSEMIKEGTSKSNKIRVQFRSPS
jgi:hypothetical protein